MRELVLFTSLFLSMTEAGFAMTPREVLKNIQWFGQACVRIQSESGKIIYIDPYQLHSNDYADIILITHSHSDHYSPGDIAKLTNDGKIIVAPFPVEGGIVLKANQSTNIQGIQVEAVPAYNIIKKDNHPKSNAWVGYIITVDGVRIYHSGDTERIPEMKNIHCDIAMLPLGQTYTMSSVQEAVNAALDVKAKIAIPIHFGMYEGKTIDADIFVKTLRQKGIEAMVLEKK